MIKPDPQHSHYRFWKHISEGGSVYRDDKLNNEQEVLTLEKLGGDATKIYCYGYQDLTVLDDSPK